MTEVIKNCVVQCRISSLKQSQGDSLETQEISIRNYVNSHGWKIVPDGRVWKTVISGRKTERDDYKEIISFIKSHPGLVHYYIFKAIDRLTRAGAPEYERMRAELASHGVEMIDISGIIQPTKNTLEEYNVKYSWSESRPSEITENILATSAKQEVTNILTRMIGQEIRLTREGYRMRRPADGFINNKVYIDGKKRPIQIPDPKRARFFLTMFELRARGLRDILIVKKLNAMGYKSPTLNKWNKDHTKIIGHSGGKPLSVKQLQRHIKNVAYAGFVCEKWTMYQPIKIAYEDSKLVTIELFNCANRGAFSLMKTENDNYKIVKGPPRTGSIRNKNNPLFPFKSLLCDLCRKPLLGSSPRGKSGKGFPTYHCSRGHKHFGIPKSILESEVNKFVNNLRFRPELLNSLELILVNKYHEREKELLLASSDIHQNIAELQDEQAGKYDALVASRSSIVRQKLEHDIDELEARIGAAKKERLTLEVSESDIKSFVREAKRIMEHPAKILLNQDDLDIQRSMFSLIFEEMPTYSEIVNGTPKLSWIFELSSESAQGKSQLVTPRGFEPRFQE